MSQTAWSLEGIFNRSIIQARCAQFPRGLPEALCESPGFKVYELNKCHFCSCSFSSSSISQPFLLDQLEQSLRARKDKDHSTAEAKSHFPHTRNTGSLALWYRAINSLFRSTTQNLVSKHLLKTDTYALAFSLLTFFLSSYSFPFYNLFFHCKPVTGLSQVRS